MSSTTKLWNLVQKINPPGPVLAQRRGFDVLRVSMATSDGSTSSSESFPAEPLQPRSFHFPKREFGEMTVVKRSFNPGWFDRYKWLHYDETEDAAFLPCWSMCSRSKKAESEPQGRRWISHKERTRRATKPGSHRYASGHTHIPCDESRDPLQQRSVTWP